MSSAYQPWMEQGICRQVDPELFFTQETMRGRGLLLMEQQAKKICNTCPVKQECLDFALRTKEPHGMWGGASARERAKMLRQSKKVA